MSRHAPYAVVLDCVGGKDVVQHMDNLVLHDPKAPHLGIYVTIVGDSEWHYDVSNLSAPSLFPISSALSRLFDGSALSIASGRALPFSIASTLSMCCLLSHHPPPTLSRADTQKLDVMLWEEL